MELDQLKVIWNSQNGAPLFAITEKDLQVLVSNRNREIDRREAPNYRLNTFLPFVAGLVMFVFAGAAAAGHPEWVMLAQKNGPPVTGWDVAAFSIAGMLAVGCAVYVVVAQRRQRSVVDEVRDDSLRGDLERGLRQVRYHTAMSRSALWWGHVPNYLGAMLWILTSFRLMGADQRALLSVTAALTGTLPILVAIEYYKISKRFEPRRRELERLRDKLTESD